MNFWIFLPQKQGIQRRLDSNSQPHREYHRNFLVLGMPVVGIKENPQTKARTIPWVLPPPSNSDHQNYDFFSRESL